MRYRTPRAAFVIVDANEGKAMTTRCTPAVLCERLKQLGFARSSQVRLYGDKWELLSDPFTDGADFVVQARSERQVATSTLKIPKFIVKGVDAA